MLAVCLKAAIPVGQKGMGSRRPLFTGNTLGARQAALLTHLHPVIAEFWWNGPRDSSKYLVLQYPLLRRHLGEQEKREEVLFKRSHSQDPVLPWLSLVPLCQTVWLAHLGLGERLKSNWPWRELGQCHWPRPLFTLLWVDKVTLLPITWEMPAIYLSVCLSVYPPSHPPGNYKYTVWLFISTWPDFAHESRVYRSFSCSLYLQFPLCSWPGHFWWPRK